MAEVLREETTTVSEAALIRSTLVDKESFMSRWACAYPAEEFDEVLLLK